MKSTLMVLGIGAILGAVVLSYLITTAFTWLILWCANALHLISWHPNIWITSLLVMCVLFIGKSLFSK